MTDAPDATESEASGSILRSPWVPRAIVGTVMVGLLVGGLVLGGVTDGIVSGEGPDIVDEERPLPIPGARDALSRTADSLGVAESGQRWSALRGDWAVEPAGAFVATTPSGPSLALIDVGTASGRFEVTAERIAPGFGIAFRCRNAGNCWRVEAVPDLGTWNIIKVVRGVEVSHGNVGLAPIADGTKITVVTELDRVIVLVNDEEKITVRDGELSDLTKAGISLREPASAPTARWRDFSVEPHVFQGVLERTEATIRDDFAQDDTDSLTAAETGESWTEFNGQFGLRNERASLLKRPESPTAPSLALLDAPSPDGIVQITMLPEQTGSGGAFRCRDADNCLYVAAVPGFGTWNIMKRVNGVESKIGDLGLSSVVPGVALSVEFVGERITVSINGQRAAEITETDFVDEVGIGLVAAADGKFVTEARWSEFLYAPSEGPTP